MTTQKNMDPAFPLSVIIPVYNGERFLAEAIESVLAQSIAVDEIIVVDDGSTDRSTEISESFSTKITLLKGDHEGVCAARNTGIRFSSGEFVALLDADDLMPRDRLKLQMEAFDSDPALDLVFGHQLRFTNAEGPPESWQGSDAEPGIMCGTLAARRRVFDVVGFFDPELKLGEFIAWITGAGEAGLTHRMLPDVLCFRRMHDSNSVKTTDNREFTFAIKKILDRRRKAESGDE